ncbi:peptide chain release factor 1 [Thermoanaerobacterium sp. RBIITD]|uniref:peptide chain release factor 1 n=1 Tax=Thermoanaerobacterium sp. RBIITD TaxID=1550240 RepID=UPI000BB8CBA4|nr:peptide chain release factor 1 [Thermoanaerobacterium sp. RBIITD]SNX53563.1 peptide chain release factor 1 [Thermoanaerobacterium sp. RBIITD]
MIDKLKTIEDRYVELSQKIADPDVMKNMAEWQKLVKEHASLEEIVQKYREYKKVLDDINSTKEIIELDDDLKDMAQEELRGLEEKENNILNEIKLLLIPKDPNDDKDVIMEIRAGAGGEEAALFAYDLFRMYTMYAEKRHWKYEVMSSNATELGGFKEVVLNITGKGAYSRLKYESGVHRVQRIPTTEAGGRIHTSTATVAVLPEVEDVDIEINPNDIKIDVFRSGGHGGQSVNTTDSAVRLTHIPTGIVISCQDERSQLQNRERAMKILRAKLYEMAQEEKEKEISETRKSQVGTGDRSERIRTYNFPQGRVTDHRIGLTLYKLQMVLDGDLDEIIDALATEDQAEKLENIE